MWQCIEKQLNEGYNESLNKLFVEWKASYEEDKRYLFCEDGLIVKYQSDNREYDINKAWHDAERKIMFIVKDCPDEWGYDTRRLLVGYENHKGSQDNAEKTRDLKGRTGYFKNIARMLHGLQYMTESNRGKELDDQLYNNNLIKQTFNNIPFAYIEAKKLAGGRKCDSKELRKALECDGAFLAQEINILRPNIIVCCDQNGDIFNSVVKNCFQNQLPTEDAKWDYIYEKEDGSNCDFNCKLYYYKKERVLLFQSYHPTRLGKKECKIYKKVLSPFSRYFERFKTFDIVSSVASK